MITIIILSLLHYVVGDIIMETYPDNYLEIDNVFALSLWIAGVCSCVGLVCNHKKNNPFKIVPKEDYIYDKKYYKLKLKNVNDLQKVKKDLKELCKAIHHIETSNKKITYLEQNSLNSLNIPNDIKFKFGKAPIQYTIDGKYYHGVDPFTYYKWNEDGSRTGCMFHYTNINRKLPTPKWDTHEIIGFCDDCSYNHNLNKNSKKIFAYNCNGHTN